MIKIKGNKNDFELAGGSSYQGKITEVYMEETNLKPIFVRVSVRFELARIRVIESELYYLFW